MGLVLGKNWIKEEFGEIKHAEYHTGIGTILRLTIIKEGDGQKRVVPHEKVSENLQVSKSDLSLVAGAAEALHDQFGKFKLALPALGIDTEINSSKGIEEVIANVIIEALKSGKIDLF